MYRTNDPRFRRRLNEIGQTLESANESAQSGLYIFGQSYVRPCLASVGNCFAGCIDASCPTLNLQSRDRLRRQRGRARSRGRAELNFDFYDDWDEEEADGLLGWGNDEFDRLVAGGSGYGTVSQTQPARQRGMSYPNDRRRKSAHDGTTTTDGLPGSGFFGRLFGGGKGVRYKPSAADLQEHPGARRQRKDVPEGEALLEEDENAEGHRQGKRHGRTRSGTTGSAGSRETQDSYSSRGDIFPSDEEDDAIPLDDEFAMVLERRNTMSGLETESSSGKTRSLKRGKRPSAGSRMSSRRTVSSRSTRSSGGRKSRSRGNSGSAQSASERGQGEIEDVAPEAVEPPSLSELTREEQRLADEEEADVVRRRDKARRAAAGRGLVEEPQSLREDVESKEATPQEMSPPATATTVPPGEASEALDGDGREVEKSQLATNPPKGDGEDEAHK